MLLCPPRPLCPPWWRFFCVLLHRAPHRLRLQFSAGRFAPRTTRRSRRRSWLSRARAARSRRRVRRRRAFTKPRVAAGIKPIIGAELTLRLRSGQATARQERQDRQDRQDRQMAGGPSSPSSPISLSSCRALRERGRLSQSVPSHHAHEAERAERRWRAVARRSRRHDRWARRACRTAGARHAPLRRRRTARSPRGTLRARSHLRRSAATFPSRRRSRQPPADRHGRGVRRAGRRHQRRAVLSASRTSALRRAHVHSPSHRSDARRSSAGAQRRAVSEAARRDGGALPRSAVCGRPRRASWPIGCSTRWRISATGFPTIPCRRAKRRRRSSGG